MVGEKIIMAMKLERGGEIDISVRLELSGVSLFRVEVESMRLSGEDHAQVYLTTGEARIIGNAFLKFADGEGKG